MVVAHVIIMSAPVQRFGFLGFSDLVWTFGPVGTGDLGLGLGLDNISYQEINSDIFVKK